VIFNQHVEPNTAFPNHFRRRQTTPRSDHPKPCRCLYGDRVWHEGSLDRRCRHYRRQRIRKTEKFAGDQVRVKLRLLKRLKPLIPRAYLQSRAELSKLSILHCPRGTNFRINRQEAEILKSLVASL